MKNLLKAFLFASLLFTQQVLAQQYFHEEGEIFSINNKYINLGDSHIPLLSTVKVIIPGKTKARIRDIKKGDYAVASVMILDKKKYVDTLRIIDKDKSEESTSPDMR